ncbi:MAG: cell division protein ZipA, partial [Neptuniibacter sp.]
EPEPEPEPEPEELPLTVEDIPVLEETLEESEKASWKPEVVEHSIPDQDLDFDKPITALMDDIAETESAPAKPSEPEGFPELDLAGVENTTPKAHDVDPQTPFDFDMPAEESDKDKTSQVSEPKAETKPVDRYENLSLGSALDDQPITQEVEVKAVDESEELGEPEAKVDVIAPAATGTVADSQKEQTPAESRKAIEKEPDPENVLVISVISKQAETFNGPMLQRIVDACGMSFGDMDIYHRFEHDDQQGAVQFSMANALPPGTFNPEQPETLSTKAVMFFMSMEEPEDVMDAFECMLATAETVAKNLGGEMLDEDRSVMRNQTAEHYRQRVRDFEMKNLKKRSK